MEIEYYKENIKIRPSQETLAIDKTYLEVFSGSGIVINRNAYGEIIDINIRDVGE